MQPLYKILALLAKIPAQKPASDLLVLEPHEKGIYRCFACCSFPGSRWQYSAETSPDCVLGRRQLFRISIDAKAGTLPLPARTFTIDLSFSLTDKSSHGADFGAGGSATVPRL